MKKIIKFCPKCEKGFSQRFGFCPNCACKLKTIEIKPVPDGSDKVENLAPNLNLKNNKQNNSLTNDLEQVEENGVRLKEEKVASKRILVENHSFLQLQEYQVEKSNFEETEIRDAGNTNYSVSYWDPWSKYIVFSGRASRKEYWKFQLINAVIFSTFVFLSQGQEGLIVGLFSLVVLVPTIAVTVRRLHDTNRTGLFALYLILPFIGFLGILPFLLQKGTKDENFYGSDPYT
ncbi:MAG: DUF805 domain-containing protein [Pyrinomonadaceae bacterium]